MSDENDDKVMVPLETVKDIANYMLAHPRATVMDVMAEFDLSDDQAFFALATAFDLSDDQAFFALATARCVIQELAREN